LAHRCAHSFRSGTNSLHRKALLSSAAHSQRTRMPKGYTEHTHTTSSTHSRKHTFTHTHTHIYKHTCMHACAGLGGACCDTMHTRALHPAAAQQDKLRAPAPAVPGRQHAFGVCVCVCVCVCVSKGGHVCEDAAVC
jgi:hypothetical protein